MSTRGSLALLTLLVLVVHLWLADQVQADHWGLGAGRGAGAAMPQRMQVAFVRELAPAAPPRVQPAAAAAAAVRRRTVAVPPAGAASASAPTSAPTSAADASPEAASAPVSEAAADTLPADEPPAVPAAALPAAKRMDTPTVASAPAPADTPPATTASASPSPAGSAPAGTAAPAVPPAQVNNSVAFEWPPSTRLSYKLTGYYRGPVEGQAQVEWVLQGARYQVHMDLRVGPGFAPLASRRVSSEGRITPQGLAPQRYDEETKALFQQTRRSTVWLDDERVRLADGSERPRPPGVQDSASQFVHLTWLFTTQPDLLQAGRSITLPLALPNQLEPWVYDVLGAETLHTPAGEVPSFHVKPRRAPRAGVDLTAELWVAPSLQYLPVRILIRQDAETYLDLLIERLPQQAAPGR